MRYILFFLLTLLVYNTSLGQAAIPKNKFNSPAKVLNIIFEAARTNNPELLKGLCPPTKENDGDTDCICALNKEYNPHKCDDNSPSNVTWKGFVEYFKKGKIIGKTEIINNYARIPFLFGKNGDESETMKLIKINGRWYLSSF